MVGWSQPQYGSERGTCPCGRPASVGDGV